MSFDDDVLAPALSYDELYRGAHHGNGEGSGSDYSRTPDTSRPSSITYLSTRLDEVEAEQVRWLWEGRLPVGKLVILDGDPDMGKSTLMLDLAARVTTGQPMPGDHMVLTSGRHVVLMSAEDGLADTVRPRLDAAGADASMVHHFDAVEVLNEKDEVIDRRPPSIPGDIAAMEQLIKDTGAALVLVDVLMAYLHGNVNSYRDQDVRLALAKLAVVAERTGACIVLFRHLTKGSAGSQAIYRGGGSIGIVGAARVGLLAALDPDDERRRVLAVAKCNVARKRPAMAYRLVEDASRGCARIEWLGETTHTADQLVVSRDDARDDDATSVLKAILSDGAVWANQGFDAMADAGFSKDQTKRAKAKLKVRTTKVGKPGDADQGWQWSLPTPRTEHEGSEGSRVHTQHPSHPSGRDCSNATDATRVLRDAFGDDIEERAGW